MTDQNNSDLQKELTPAEKRAADAKKRLTPGYQHNHFNNRKERRLAAKRSGYLRHGWGAYRAVENNQTVRKEKG